jgi:hypothetical protein
VSLVRKSAFLGTYIHMYSTYFALPALPPLCAELAPPQRPRFVQGPSSPLQPKDKSDIQDIGLAKRCA